MYVRTYACMHVCMYVCMYALCITLVIMEIMSMRNPLNYDKRILSMINENLLFNPHYSIHIAISMLTLLVYSKFYTFKPI